ncbi:unnamed protein product [Dibothriocephalus latus]|uniref:Coiled-coil domain-containing protein 39 n=1 Tax=Dibothriocephalus latus TaxID=60516 RepID=A0A3P7LG38_DIBLA|nr:unnamed protein product [Dibothriocephalus latus]
MMKSHRDQVTNELQEIQQIYASYCRSLETSENIISVCERERERIGGDLRKLKTGITKMKEKQTSLENTALKKNLEIQSAKRKMNIDAQTLELWMDENERKSDDIVAINKYHHMDDRLIKELSLSLEKVTTEYHRKKSLLTKGRIELEMHEVSIEKMGQSQRDAVKERQNVLVHWEKTVEHCGKREKEVEKLAQHYGDLLEKLNSDKAICREKTAFLASQQENNKEAQRKIERNEKIILGLRQEISRIKMEMEELEKEASKLEDLAQQSDILQQRLLVITDSKMTAEQMMLEAEKQFQQEEGYKAELSRILATLRKEHYEIKNTLRAATEEKRLTQTSIDSGLSALRNLENTVSKLNEETRRQQDIKYSLVSHKHYLKFFLYLHFSAIRVFTLPLRQIQSAKECRLTELQLFWAGHHKLG